jgi:calcium-dependent protein kinase
MMDDAEDGEKSSRTQDTLAGLPPCSFRGPTEDTALPSTDRSALRLALCEQAFLQAGVLNDGHVNMSQHKLGLIFVFEQLGEIPLPDDVWSERIFAELDVEEEGWLNFERFVDAATRWDENCERRRRHREALLVAADSQAASPPARISEESTIGPRIAEPFRISRALSFVGEEECPAAVPSGALPSVAEETPSKTELIPEGVGRETRSEPSSPKRRRFPSSGRWQPVQTSCGRFGMGRRRSLAGCGRGSRSCSPCRSSSSSSTAINIAPEVRVPTYVGEQLIFKHYEFLRPLGEGAYGIVEAVCHKVTRHIRASKTIAITQVGQHEQVETEIALLKLLNHPNIMKLHEVYYDYDPALHECTGTVYLVTELCHGGDLLWRMAWHHVKIKRLMGEVRVAYIMRQILSAIRYCHGLGVMHRDIKPANILFIGSSATSPVKLIDFGYAAFTQRIRQTAREKNVPRSGTLGRLARILPTVGGKELLPRHVRQQDMEAVGTSHYMAPELIAGSYDEKADLFSLGVVLCELLTGQHPFYIPRIDDEEGVKAKITSRDPVVELPCAILPGDPISNTAQNMCLALLQKNPRRRLSARQALAHPWFSAPNTPMSFTNIDVLSIFHALTTYKSYNKLKRAVLQLYANDLPDDEIHELCGKFMALDAKGDGHLSANELSKVAQRVGCELSSEELYEIVAALDTSGQGRIGYKEFAAVLVETSKVLDEMRLYQCFRRLDSRGSERVSFEDVSKVLCSSDGATPGISQSEWEDIVVPISPNRSQVDKDSRPNTRSASVELTFDAFLRLMQAQGAARDAVTNGPKDDIDHTTSPHGESRILQQSAAGLVVAESDGHVPQLRSCLEG